MRHKILMVLVGCAAAVAQARMETRWKDCADCSGNGTEVCSVCQGEGWVNSVTKDSNLGETLGGLVALPFEIVGGVAEGLANPKAKNHIGMKPCKACKGKGKIGCSSCNGEGRTSYQVTLADPPPRRTLSNYERVSPSIAIISSSYNGNYWTATGFIARDGNRVYLYTNRHVVIHDGELVDTLRADFLNGVYIDLTPNTVQLPSDGRDVARFLVTGCDNLALSIYAKGPTRGERVYIYGNTLGRTVITEAKGKISAVGPCMLEHTCDTAQGNSGSPILDVNLEVVGIDTMSCREDPKDETVLDDSAWNGRVRNFGTSIVNVSWQ